MKNYCIQYRNTIFLNSMDRFKLEASKQLLRSKIKKSVATAFIL